MTQSSGANYSDLRTRVISAIVMIIVAVAAFWTGLALVVPLVAIATILMLWEYWRLFTHNGEPDVIPLWITGLCGLAAIVCAALETMVIAIIPVLAGCIALFFADRGRIKWTLPGLIYITLAMAILVQIRRVPDFGLIIVVWIALVVMAADIGGYFAGRSFGGPKLWPAVSPKKTWSGTLGGWVLALCVGVAFHFGGWLQGAVGYIIPLSIGLAMASQAGDLLESAMKRHFGVKDASNLIPGHGGLLDRFDGLLAALLCYWLLSSLTGMAA